MAKIDFNIIITNEAVQYAREASLNPGWYLTPKKWGISTTSGQLTVDRTTESMFTTWIKQPYSGIYPTGTNKLMHSVVIPPDAYANEIIIGEIYFIYEDYYGNEFLYAIAQPTTSLIFTPGISQSYSFIFTLNNTTVADTFTINYTYPQEIEDHNQLDDAHIPLLRKDGQRKATGILQYETKLDFKNNRDIIDKEYADKVTDKIQSDINLEYCPVGSMMWWPSTKPPRGWVARDGAAYSRTTYKNLFDVIGTIYGQGDGSTTFNVPDDRGLFLRGYQSGVTSNFGQKQSSQGSVTVANNGWSRNSQHSGGTAGYLIASSGRGEIAEVLESIGMVTAARAFDVSNNLAPSNRNYLPIIKY